MTESTLTHEEVRDLYKLYADKIIITAKTENPDTMTDQIIMKVSRKLVEQLTYKYNFDNLMYTFLISGRHLPETCTMRTPAMWGAIFLAATAFAEMVNRFCKGETQYDKHIEYFIFKWEHLEYEMWSYTLDILQKGENPVSDERNTSENAKIIHAYQQNERTDADLVEVLLDNRILTAFQSLGDGFITLKELAIRFITSYEDIIPGEKVIQAVNDSTPVMLTTLQTFILICYNHSPLSPDECHQIQLHLPLGAMLSALGIAGVNYKRKIAETLKKMAVDHSAMGKSTINAVVILIKQMLITCEALKNGEKWEKIHNGYELSNLQVALHTYLRCIKADTLVKKGAYTHGVERITDRDHSNSLKMADFYRENKDKLNLQSNEAGQRQDELEDTTLFRVKLSDDLKTLLEPDDRYDP